MKLIFELVEIRFRQSMAPLHCDEGAVCFIDIVEGHPHAHIAPFGTGIKVGGVAMDELLTPMFKKQGRVERGFSESIAYFLPRVHGG